MVGCRLCKPATMVGAGWFRGGGRFLQGGQGCHRGDGEDNQLLAAHRRVKFARWQHIDTLELKT